MYSKATSVHNIKKYTKSIHTTIISLFVIFYFRFWTILFMMALRFINFFLNWQCIILLIAVAYNIISGQSKYSVNSQIPSYLYLILKNKCISKLGQKLKFEVLSK